MSNIEQVLHAQRIPFQRFEHPAVRTCEESAKLCPAMPGMHTKNLFLKDDKNRRHVLLSLPHGKVAHLKDFGRTYGIKSPSLASAEDLKNYLGVEPGAVTLLGLIHDTDHHIEVFLDEELWKHDEIGCHPLVNTATLVIARADMERFFAATGHVFRVCAVPSKFPLPMGEPAGRPAGVQGEGLEERESTVSNASLTISKVRSISASVWTSDRYILPPGVQ